ncbi:TolC family protein [Aquimarina gracilis]|uniref:TolC family protein n=1 Tax=Aquimarina gracilis TaxID=874422 RepID=A0ABU5ZTN6_9FLAO|nr:TolC family protein [Aquimarina gracilis]MEB3345388.1 TolC family protein [Aquimarina gracilis]
MRFKRHIQHFVIFSFSLFIFHFSSAQQLQSYINEAHTNNPNIQAYELRYNIAQEKVTEANWLPNTEFAAGYFISEPETRTGAQVARFSVKQMLPWFGTVSVRQDYATAMAEADYVDYIIAKRKLTLAVSKSYYQLYSLKAKQKVLNGNIRLLKTYKTLALTSIEVGKASAVDVLQLQIRQNELQQHIEVLKEQILAEKVKFNSLLSRDTSLAIDLIPEMFIPNNDPIISDSLQLNPELLRFDKMYESITQVELLNQKEGAPMLGFGLDYVPVQERSDISFSDNGKDIVMPMVSVSIPIFNKKYTSRTKQNELRKQEVTLQKQERLHLLESAFAKAVSQRNQARITYTTQSKNLKQAKDAEQILIKNYETGTIDFNDVLDIQELQLKFQLNQIQSVTRYYIQSAIINYLSN